jgi:hypothetical protein
LSHRKQDEDKKINKNAEHKTQNNAENQKDGQPYIYIYYICCSYEMYTVDSSNNELPGVLGKSKYTVILTIQTPLISRHKQ